MPGPKTTRPSPRCSNRGTGEHRQSHGDPEAAQAEPCPSHCSQFGVAKTKGRLAQDSFGKGAQALHHQKSGRAGDQMIEENRLWVITAAPPGQKSCGEDAADHPCSADRFRQPQVVEIDQNQRQ